MTIKVGAEGLTGLDERAAGTQHFGPLFPLADGDPVATMVALTAARAVEELPDDPELIAGLRKLLEARDCFARAAALARRAK